MSEQTPPSGKVFVVHGRNVAARDALFDFLRAIGLQPIEWSQAVSLTGKGSPYVGEILDAAFAAAQAIVVMMTPDEVAYLRSEYASADDDAEKQPAGQARPNVLFEAGLALGRSPDRTILVELGRVRPFSDVAGRHVLRLTGSPEGRKDLAERLRTAGCSVDLSGTDWLTKGNLVAPAEPGGGLPLGKRLPKPSPKNEVKIDVNYFARGGGDGRLQVTNRSSFAVHDLQLAIPPEARQSFHVMDSDQVIAKLPSGKTVGYMTSRTMGPGADHFEIKISGRTSEGEPFETEAFVSLLA